MLNLPLLGRLNREIFKMTQYAFYFDQSRCFNCHACVVGCRDWNNIDAGPVKWLRMLQWEKNAYPETRIQAVFATCYHCENPVCISSCPEGALFKEDQFGAVLLNEERCTGCRNCWTACPYGATQFADDAIGTKMSKCDMCYDRLLEGKIPICVGACIGRALDFGPIEEMEKKYGNLRELEGMPSGDETKPAIIFKPINERAQVVPYDSKRALELMRERHQLPPLFDKMEDVTELYEGLVGYDKLVMKSATTAENLALSKNEEG